MRMPVRKSNYFDRPCTTKMKLRGSYLRVVLFSYPPHKVMVWRPVSWVADRAYLSLITTVNLKSVAVFASFVDCSIAIDRQLRGDTPLFLRSTSVVVDY